MGRAIVRDPKVFLFDEPLSNLDAELRVRMRAEIRELHNRLGATTIYVTHDQVEAMTMADNIVVLRDGCVEQIGAPLELYDKPANTFVARFIGSPAMNIFPIQVIDGGVAVLHDATPLPLPSRIEQPVGSAILCGIRPEHLQLAETGGVPATVRHAEVQGAETLIVAQLGPVDLTVLIHERRSLAVGNTVRLAFDKSVVHFFDERTHQRVLFS
jgi:multiple sugar transport system ATP-binding protein